MSSKKLVGIIGAGFGRYVHLPAFGRNKAYKVVSICASTSNKSAAINQELNLSHPHGQWQSMISDPHINTISIAVPPHKQFKIALAAIGAKKDVLLEKPLALNAKESKLLLRLAEKNKVNCLVDFEFAVLPVFEKAKRIIDSGRLGSIREVQVQWNTEIYAIRHNTKSWKTSCRQGGGALSSFGSHVLHYLEWFMGPIHSLESRLNAPCDLSTKAETSVDLWTRFKSGANGNIAITTASPGGGGHRIDIYGSKGRLLLENTGPDHIRDFELTVSKEGGLAQKVATRALSASNLIDGRIMAVAQVIQLLNSTKESPAKQRLGLIKAHRVQVLMDYVIKSNKFKKEIICTQKKY